MSGINLGPITVVSQLTAAPSSPVGGQLYYDTDDGNLYVYDAQATGWVDCTVQGASAGATNTWTALQTFRDTTFEITDQTDTTKKFVFEASGIAAGTTRTLTVPNANGTLALTSDLSSYALLGSANNFTAAQQISGGAGAAALTLTGSTNEGITSAATVSTSRTFLAVRQSADTQWRFRVDAGGVLTMGPGGSTAPDITLSRTGTAAATLSGSLAASGGLITKAVAGTPSDALADGGLEVDSTNHKLFFRSGGSWRDATTKVFYTFQTWTVPDTIAVPSGDTDFIPPFFIPLPASGQSVRLIEARHRINSGTSATVKLTRNGTDITGWTGISVTTTATSTTGTATALSDNDLLALVVTAVSGTPKNMSFTLVLEHTVV